MKRRGDNYQFMRHQRFHHKTVWSLDEAHHRQVYLVGEEILFNGTAIHNRQCDANAWVASVEGTKQWNHYIRTSTGTGPHHDTSACQCMNLTNYRCGLCK